MSNEIRVDALDIKVFTKNCVSALDCNINENKGSLITELKKSILKKAAVYEQQQKKSGKEYLTNPTTSR